MMGKANYVLEALTPIHVGSGQKLLPSDYVIDQKEKLVVRIDLDALLRDRSFPVGRYIEMVKRPGFSMEREFKTSGLLYPRYRLGAGGTLDELVKHLGQPAAVIIEQIKDGGRPYLPGSSIKGALRSVLLRSLVPKRQKEFEDSLTDALDRRRRREFFSSSAEDRLLGRTNFSLLRALQVSDSSVIKPEEMDLGCAKVLSLSNTGYRWKDMGRSARQTNLDRHQEATPIFFEAIPPGTTLTGMLKIDPGLLEDEMARTLNFSPEGMRALKEMATTGRQGAGELLRRELDFFSRIGMEEGEKSIQRLLKIHEGCGENQFLLPLSWGTGYLAKTAGWKIDGRLMGEIRERHRLGREGFEFPKSRKLYFSHGQPQGPVGWAKITLEG